MGLYMAWVVMTVVAIVIVILNRNDILVAMMGMLLNLWPVSVIAVLVWLNAMVTGLNMPPLRR